MSCRRYILWIDGVGAFQLCTGDRFVLGAPSFENRSADIALVANVSRKHATISRHRDAWRLEAHHNTRVAGQPVSGSVVLKSGDEICPAERVKLGFRVPSALSSSAVIDFESDHRPSYSVDGIILMADHCLLGPRSDHHVWCRHWPDMVVLFCQDGQLLCRSKSALAIDEVDIRESGILRHGSVVTSDDIRFRVEEMT
ncbi:MAG: FHA domain-containing protein [Planctomycetaceae bacterium]